MSDLRQAAQQALEALTNCNSEYGHRCSRCDSEVDEGGKVAEALKQALAEPTRAEKMRAAGYTRRPTLRELVRELAEPESIEDVVMYGSAWSKDGKRIDPMSVYKEPEQPVAWVFRYSDGSFDQPSLTEHSSGMIPLYTAPTPRRPLTDEQIDELSRTMVKGDKSVNWLCRAIEAAHGITGEQT